MSDLVEWLTTILDEDERAARAVKPLGSVGLMDGKSYPDTFGHSRDSRASEDGYPKTLSDAGAQAHFERHEPSAVLADVAAKRAIIALHDGSHSCTELITGTYSDDWPEFMPWGKPGDHWQHPSNEHMPDSDSPCPTLCALASAYADRDGYRKDWRP